jgi:hypothetical protein
MACIYKYKGNGFKTKGELINFLKATDSTKFQQDTITEVSSTPQEIVDAVLTKLKETGLAKEVHSMTSSQIEEKLVSLGVTINIAKQVIAWHGTSNPQKDILKVTNKNESRYGELLSGNYFGGKEMATWFSGKIVEQSRLFEVAIEEEEFAVVDMKGKTPVGTEELFEDGVMSKEEFDNLLARKKSGEIKGLILENSTEEGFKDSHTQYLVFDESVMEKLQTIEYTEVETNEAPVSKVFLAMQTAGISVTPNGFVHEGEVFLNTDSGNLLNTQIHEFGHLFNSWAKANRKDIYDKGIDLIKTEAGEAYVNFVKLAQPNLEGEELYEEALTQAIGDQGQMIVEENAKESFGEWMMSLWAAIKDTLGISNMTDEQVSTLTLGEFSKAVATDLLDGKAPFDGTNSFERWKGENELVSDYQVQDVKTGQPVVIEGYHGTTNEFYEFDATVKGTVEGHLGRMNYFTSDISDAEANYMAEGSDITQRVDTRADRVKDEIEQDFTNIDDDIDIKAVMREYDLEEEDMDTMFPDGVPSDVQAGDLAYYIADKEIRGTQDKVMELYIKLNNPLVLGSGAVWTESIPSELYEEYLEDSAKEIAEENDVSVTDAKNDLMYEIRDRAIESAGIWNSPIQEALQDAINENSDATIDATEVLSEYYEDEIDLESLEATIRSKMRFETTEEGDQVGNQITSQFFKNLGYDGIILTNVSKRFPGMQLSNNTSHIHVFDEFSNQIKSMEGENVVFSESTKDIRYQKPQVPTGVQKESIENTSSIFDSQLELLDLYSSKEEAQIKKDTDCG